MKTRIYLLAALGLFSVSLPAKDYLVSTGNTSLLLTVEKGEKPKFQYYGSRISPADIQSVYDSGLAFNADSYPVFRLNTAGERAMAVTHADGNMSLDLAVEEVRQYSDDEGEITEICMKDKVYPFCVKQCFKAYKESDIISTWVEAENMGKKPVTLYRFASAFLPVRRGENWLTHFHGHWGGLSQRWKKKSSLTGRK